MKPRIIVTRRWPDAVERVLAERFDVTLNQGDIPFTSTQLKAAMAGFDAILPTVSDKLPASVFPDEDGRTKLIANFGVGFSHIDLDAARQRGILVTNTPGVLTDCTADIALSLLLAVARRTGEGERQLRAGKWSGWCPTHMIGAKVSGKTLGIIGMGRIGKAVAKRARFGFGMDIIFFNRSRVDDDELRAMAATQVSSIEEVLNRSDFVSLHCPGGAENRHLIDVKRIGAMKPGGFLINTARGDVVDQDALIQALENRTIAGAGLDVFAEEPLVPERLLRLNNVVLLPHLGSATEETRVAMGMKAVDNLIAFSEGRQPPDRVT
ncbi:MULTISPECIES: D-glycerate dehydrogenase [unclassified Mesorhizobium]|uniref:2-hydroxyacid dehydrogenase n=1 Tax=unclassified Mesorhizobium TaxID=325217 RepID=UPI0010937673|nr:MULTISPECIES: D-glycerate dehydrogenase [unclassified Mesorhizobium]TGQ77249.1 D-glycerate dehydrogenase [Mesorhizobium sp. M8A.F.Ca.ET.207.01.1.1]TGS39002.1 D-glycerate dehydrogenase [Mesorhizobium sp. M8A.F.Ca.ET.182.01.1.1]TGS77283.1 D-glycerate dehydrogenase [Mesorhizobium sp. M8A.F.Ca.ET.181.01.1.1]TGT36336.1 D-glycerate dehydrogenase [Mesorhizobium sp. M8A.F.Ca.ET.165.01.1.1]